MLVRAQRGFRNWVSLSKMHAHIQHIKLPNWCSAERRRLRVSVRHTGKKTPGGAGTHTGSCKVRLCDQCARVRPCVSCVSRLPRLFKLRGYCHSHQNSRAGGRVCYGGLHGGRLRLAWHESFRGSLYARQLARFARLWWMDVACCKGLPGRQIAPLAWVCFEETEGTCETLEKALKV